ncbi:ESX secretion-associated protein EspG [Williamsia sp. SKLECPSW1]
MMTGSLTEHRMTLAEVLVVCDLLSVQTLPSVLRVEEASDDDRVAQQVRAAASASLVEKGAIDSDGIPDPDLRQLFSALADPDWLVEMRRVDVTQVLRLCIVGDGESRFLATRNGDSLTFVPVFATDDAELIVNEIRPLIGATRGAAVESVRYPSDVFDTALATCDDEMSHAEAFFGLGMAEPAARGLARVLCGAVGQTEIVAEFDRPADRVVVAVFDTADGRVVSVSAPGYAGDRWTSIMPGHDHAVVGALRRLAEILPGGEA